MHQRSLVAASSSAAAVLGASWSSPGRRESDEGTASLFPFRPRLVEAQTTSHFPSGQGAAHGPWNDPTFCKTSAEIHAPRYFSNYEEFGDKLKNYKGELHIKEFLTQDMYKKYKDQKTVLGVTLDKCIKGGVDVATHGSEWNVGKVGLLFGDAECVTKFEDLVKPIMVRRHNNPKLPHPPPNLDGSKLLDHTALIDSKYVISTRVRTGRSISGFPLPPSISADQRKELEGIVVGALSRLEGNLKGDYYPLAGSTTYAPKPKGIDKATEDRLIKDHFLFQEPDEPMLLSWRMERDWPHARGIYHNNAKTALVWVNEEDHLRIISMEKGYNIRAVFDRFADLVKAVETACKGVGRKLEISEMYGNILSCPSNCGTGLRASMMIKIPYASKEPNFKKWLADRSLQARGSGGFASSAKDDGIRDVSNVDRMGKDEVTLVNEMIRGVADLINWEKELEKEKGGGLHKIKRMWRGMFGKKQEKKGAAHGPWKDDTYCATSSEIHAPKYFKSYEEIGSKLQAYTGELHVKEFLTKDMYNKYKDQKTALGVTLDKCIKGGVDVATHGSDWNVGKVGLLFGDAECVTKFEDLVKPIMMRRHNNPKLPHPPPNLDGSKLLDHTKLIDPSYVLSTRVRTGRSISGFPLPPSISADQRKELEGIVVGALSRLEGNLKGDYYPLAGSTTYAPKPKGIDKATEARLIKDHFLFQEPDEPMLLSWRMERDWPHARGIYHNESKTALVWVNEEDHLRIISMEKGYNIRAVFDRFANLVKAVETACIGVGRKLEISEMYGNILSCPSNCGTGLRASMMIKIPNASKQPNFKKWLADRNLQARGSGGFASAAKDDGIRDVSNVDRMGKDEVTLVNEMIAGVADLIKWEKELEGKSR